MKNKALIICISLVFVLTSGVVYILMTPSENVVYQSDRQEPISANLTSEEKVRNDDSEEKIVENVDKTSQISHNDIVVYICGNVNHEGVYTLDEGSRVFEALELAGGLTQDAQSDYINLARVLEDGESIYFPNQTEVEELKLNQWESSVEETEARININKASQSELTELPGIGTAKAKAIISYREKNQSFETIEQIMEVPGIKENTFEIIKEFISI